MKKKFFFLMMLLVCSIGQLWAEKITTIAGITSGNKYYIGATVSETDYYFKTDVSKAATGVSGTSTTDKAEAVVATITKTTGGYTIQVGDGLYLSLASSKANGKVNIVEAAEDWTFSEVSNLINMKINGYCLMKNSGTSLNFGSYGSGQTNVWLEDAGAPVPPARVLQSIYVDGTATKLEYFVGESFDPAGLKVMGKYDDELGDAEITNGVTWSFEPEVFALENTSVSVTANHKDFTSAEFTVNNIVVKEKVIPTGYAGVYTSNVELTTEGGTSATAVKVAIDETEYDAIKAGTGKIKGACVVTIPAATKTLHFHAAAWNKEVVKLDVNGTTYDLVADAAVAGSGTSYALKNDPATQDYFTFNPNGATTITFTVSADAAGFRFVLFGVNAEMQEGIVSAPSFSPSETDFVDSVEISLSCDTEDAEIFYSIGSEVTSMNAIQYTAPFTISETSTIYAVAKKDGKESEQVSKTYNKIPSFASLAELLEKLPAQETSTKVNVTLTDLPIDSFYVTKQGYKNGVYTNVNGTVVELYAYNVPETWEVGGTVSGKIIGEWLSYKGTPELQKWEGGWDALTYKPASLLPPLASNAYYSWQSPKGVVEEVGGKAVAVGDTTRVNYANITTDTKFFTICLVGKKKLEADKDGIVKYITVTLDQALAEGDTIYVYAFKNKDDASKKASIMFLWGEEGTEKTMAGGDDFPNLYGGGEPALVKYVVPKDAAGQKAFRMTRSETGTNLFIAQLQIVPNQTPTGINDISAKNAQFFGEGTYDLSGRKVMNPVKGNVYIVNGKKYLCK